MQKGLTTIVVSMATWAGVAATAGAQELPDPDGQAADRSHPVHVYILSGQSNMVGIGQVDGGGSRWGTEMIDPTLSVYPGSYNPEADYDAMEPSETLELDSIGGVEPTPYLGGGTQVVRGLV